MASGPETALLLLEQLRDALMSGGGAGVVSKDAADALLAPIRKNVESAHPVPLAESAFDDIEDALEVVLFSATPDR